MRSHFMMKKAFILYSMDVSGIQNFIYTIASKNALKTIESTVFLSGNYDGAYH